MCGPKPCNPMTPTCTWSLEWQRECLERYHESQRLIALSAADWDAAVRELRAYEQTHGKPQADKLRDEIKRQKNENIRVHT